MSRRTDLQTLFETLLGSKNVYFQPPSTVKMNYPCIVYTRRNTSNRFADDILYAHKMCYTVTLIDKDPDSVFVDKLLMFPMCTFDRHFVSDNLNHDIFNIYFKYFLIKK